ncbi:MAG: metallophosphoesterase, partial [Flavobacteriia bacterium]|nr:metallophosphoesterase [Flavobacteriia bacterium]
MNRRTFIYRTGIVVAGAAIAPSLISASGKKDQKLVILHTNDTHSNIDPFPDNHGKYPGMGGVARRATLIEQIRAEEEHVLLLDCGDIFQGTPYFNKFKGVLEMKVLSEMKYDAATLGNHDFDIGLEGFKQAKQHATFPFVNTNYDLSKTSLRDEVKQ